ncbi:fasciclin domain-containing protein [Fulvimarina sp. MAC8]|uniref:fasciclin domain-containing protein n=1 Tax=Fulvimarina sp. MAC8 TaxID=3162874 RepID=UPI0032EBFADA
MKTLLKTALIAASLGLASAPAALAQNPTVGGAAMPSNQNIVENASNSPIHTTLVSAVKQAGLVDTLASPGPFTVFAPTDAAFGKVPSSTVSMLMDPANKDQLTKVLTAHVVAGDMSAGKILARANANGGQYAMQTVSGDTITAMPEGQGLAIVDENGGKAIVTIADVDQSNGVIHVVNNVLVPQ